MRKNVVERGEVVGRGKVERFEVGRGEVERYEIWKGEVERCEVRVSQSHEYDDFEGKSEVTFKSI